MLPSELYKCLELETEYIYPKLAWNIRNITAEIKRLGTLKLDLQIPIQKRIREILRKLLMQENGNLILNDEKRFDCHPSKSQPRQSF